MYNITIPSPLSSSTVFSRSLRRSSNSDKAIFLYHVNDSLFLESNTDFKMQHRLTLKNKGELWILKILEIYILDCTITFWYPVYMNVFIIRFNSNEIERLKHHYGFKIWNYHISYHRITIHVSCSLVTCWYFCQCVKSPIISPFTYVILNTIHQAQKMK